MVTKVVTKVNIALNITNPQNIGVTRSVNKLLKILVKRGA
jgi:hypothetical protein